LDGVISQLVAERLLGLFKREPIIARTQSRKLDRRPCGLAGSLSVSRMNFDSVESLISHAVFSIPAVRAIEFGTGFAAARMSGSEHNDAIADKTGQTVTNHAGGVVGGISNGNELVFRIAIKPTSSTPKEQETFNRDTGTREVFSVKGRHDLCIALRVPVVLEAVTAMVLADFLLLEQKIPRVLK
jgi:chorismate synthase